jgi:F-type H+-transporting ATPase subunit alpha
VPDWEAQLRDYLRDSHGEILQDIRESKELSDETADKLREAIENFNRNYEPSEEGISASVEGGSEDEEEES